MMPLHLQLHIILRRGIGENLTCVHVHLHKMLEPCKCVISLLPPLWFNKRFHLKKNACMQHTVAQETSTSFKGAGK